MTSILERLRELEQTATPGPWHVGSTGLIKHHAMWIASMSGSMSNPAIATDAALIAAARNHLPQLLDIAEAALEMNVCPFCASGRVPGRIHLASCPLAALNNTEPT